MAEWELTPKLAKFLDRHLTLTLLEFLSSNNIHDEQDLFHARMELLSKTKMIDFAIDVHSKINPSEEVPEALIENRQHVVEEFKEITEQTKPILAIFEDEEIIHQIENISDGKQLFEYLEKNHGLTSEMVDTLYKFAKFQYECGNYTGAANYLSSHRSLITPQDKFYLDNLWGKLASEILMQKWENALEELNRLRDHIDNCSTFTPLQLLQQRTWIIHWSLFIYFNHTQGRDLLIEMLLERKVTNQKADKSYQPYLNAVQTICPHIIRYLTATVITHRRRRDYIKDLVKVIQQESYTYRDPVTEFVECLCVHFDFDSAQKKLRECVDVFKNDFFLTALQKEFIENARLFVFEIFCRIHQCISINMLSDKLNMSPEEAEVWIVNLIRQARLDAKIDSKQGHVVMGTQAVSPYQQLIEKTKAMGIRCQVLTMNIEKKLQSEQRWTSSSSTSATNPPTITEVN